MNTAKILGVIAGFSMACMLAACAVDTDASDDEASPVEVAVSQQAQRGTYYAYRNGLGKTTRNAQGVNMTLENYVSQLSSSGTRVRLWPNVELPDSDTVIELEINTHCVKPDGTPYDVRPAFYVETWRAGAARDRTFYGGSLCYRGDRLVLSRVDWTVDN